MLSSTAGSTIPLTGNSGMNSEYRRTVCFIPCLLCHRMITVSGSGCPRCSKDITICWFNIKVSTNFFFSTDSNHQGGGLLPVAEEIGRYRLWPDTRSDHLLDLGRIWEYWKVRNGQASSRPTRSPSSRRERRGYQVYDSYACTEKENIPPGYTLRYTQDY